MHKNAEICIKNLIKNFKDLQINKLKIYVLYKLLNIYA